MSNRAQSLLKAWAEGKSSARRGQPGIALRGSDMAAKLLGNALARTSHQTEARPGAGVLNAKELPPV
ncbi:hypothetical protein T35B1_11707 [Salinisphaera shabanensis T35B1]|uniref:hypothetical protein n=1 Tax=Salinisphaera TaxID=180541 RepID=UPI00333EE45D